MARLTRTRHATGASTTRYIDKTTSAQKTQRSLRNFLHQEEHARSICTDNSLEFIEACEKLNWNHERSAPQRSENTWNCRTSSTMGESRHFVSIGSVWTARKLAGRRNGVSLLSPKRARPNRFCVFVVVVKSLSAKPSRSVMRKEFANSASSSSHKQYAQDTCARSREGELLTVTDADTTTHEVMHLISLNMEQGAH